LPQWPPGFGDSRRSRFWRICAFSLTLLYTSSAGTTWCPIEVFLELYVGNLPWSISDDGLTSLFSAHGTVSRAKVISDRDTGRSRGFAFVTMDSAEAGNAAITALNGKDCDGRQLTVRAAEDRRAAGSDRPAGNRRF